MSEFTSIAIILFAFTVTLTITISWKITVAVIDRDKQRGIEFLTAKYTHCEIDRIEIANPRLMYAGDFIIGARFYRVEFTRGDDRKQRRTCLIRRSLLGHVAECQDIYTKCLAAMQPKEAQPDDFEVNQGNP